MRKILALLFGLIPLLSYAGSVEILGAEMTYTFSGGHNYEVKLIIYTPCGQGITDPVNITASSPDKRFTSITQAANLIDMGEVQYECSTYPLASACTNPNSSLPGIRKWMATTTFSLYRAIACEYTFSWQACCRTSLLTTGAANEPFYIEAYMNICDNVDNSSPQFTSAYSPLLLKGTCATKSNSAIAAIGGTGYLKYELVSPKTDVNKSAAFSAPYTYRKPVTNTGGFGDADFFDFMNNCWGFYLNDSSGELKLSPVNAGEIFPVSIQLNRYFNGKKISTASRELTYWVMDGYSNRTPVITGINCQKQDTIRIKPGETRCFTVCSFDPDIDDTVHLVSALDMAGATFTPEAGAKWPKGQFCWTPSKADERHEPYHLVVRSEDGNVCREIFGLPAQTYNEKVFMVYVSENPILGIDDHDSKFLTLYPNPATFKVYADLKAYSVSKVQLIDMTGKNTTPAYSFSNGKLEMDISSLPVGSYVLQVLTSQNVYSSKVIITK